MRSHMEILAWINAEIESEEEQMEDDRDAGPNSAGFNQALGARDALAKFRMWLNGEDE